MFMEQSPSFGGMARSVCVCVCVWSRQVEDGSFPFLKLARMPFIF